jgi:hypothetical protein
MTVNAVPPVIPKPPAKKRRGLIGCLVAGAVLGGGLLIWHLTARLSDSSAVRRLKAAARERGEPLTAAAVAASYLAVPDTENAAVALMALWEKEDPVFWKAFRAGQRPLPDHAQREFDPALPYRGVEAKAFLPRAPLDPDTRKAAEEWTASHQAHLAAVREALRRPRCRFPLALEQNFAAPTPHLPEIKSEVINFQIEALLAMERGEIDQAIGALTNSVRLAQLLADEPTLLSQLVRISCLNLGLGNGERLLCRQALSPAQLEQVRALFESMQTGDALKRAFICERALAMNVFDAPLQAFADPVPGVWETKRDSEYEAKSFRSGMGLMRNLGLLGRDQRLLLETYETAIRLAGDDSPKAVQETEEAFSSAVEQARGFPQRVFSGLLLSGLERVRSRFAALEARRRAGLAAVAIERSRLAHQGAVPGKLEALVPQFLSAMPIDPFDGQPLRYRPLPRGYLVYSVGADRQDDGGREKSAKGATRNYDETFIIER